MIEITSRSDFGQMVQEYFKTGIGAEIGVEYGHNSKKILSQWRGELICVDMWANSRIEEFAKKNLIDERCYLIKDSSVNAATKVNDESLDFVYIDADHDYANCMADIKAWFPKVRHGGIVAGHDYLNWTKAQGGGCEFGVKAAVDEFCAKHGYKLHVASDDMWEGDPYPTWYFVKEVPRIIYFTWVSPDPLPGWANKYIDGWKVMMPDYQIIQISLDNIVKSPFVLEAIRRKKYSVAGHYGRCERLYETGGIYFDIDIESARRFDALLGNKFFVGLEKPHRVNNAVMGSAPGHPFLKECIDFMDRFDFDNPGPLGMEIHTGPEMFTQVAKKYGYKEEDRTQLLREDVTVFNSKVFYPYYFDERYRPGCVTPETFAVHHWAASWLGNNKKA